MSPGVYKGTHGFSSLAHIRLGRHTLASRVFSSRIDNTARDPTSIIRDNTKASYEWLSSFLCSFDKIS